MKVILQAFNGLLESKIQDYGGSHKPELHLSMSRPAPKRIEVDEIPDPKVNVGIFEYKISVQREKDQIFIYELVNIR